MIARNSVFASAFALASLFPALSATSKAAELVMVDSRACSYCAKFNREMSDAYDSSQAARIAPLRRISALKKWPDDLSGVNRTHFTPVFIVVDGGREVGRFAGYNGPDGFWSRLGPLLAEIN